MRRNGIFDGRLWLLAAALSACAQGGGDYPSLAMRPFETAPPSAQGPAPSPIRPGTPAARLAELRAAAEGADAAFTARAPEAARLARAAAGQPFESRARASAMVALADLDSKRAATAGTLATLDSLAAEAAAALGEDPSLASLQGEVAATLARQDAAIAQLWEVMGS